MSEKSKRDTAATLKQEKNKTSARKKKEEAVKFDFSSTFTGNFPGILESLNLSLAVTSYQSGRLFFVRSRDDAIDTHFKRFRRPMGVYADQERLTVGTLTQVIDFRRNDGILRQLQSDDLDGQQKLSRKVLTKLEEKKKEKFLRNRKREQAEFRKADALFIPRASLTTGMINIHDIAWGDEGLWVVNSTFSCLATLSPDHSFVPRWKPHFISALAPEDRCHLNGMAMRGGKPAYVTTFNKYDERDSWHKSTEFDGTLMDVASNEILVDGLCMPHSPRYHQGKVYYCDSGKGLVCSYDPETCTNAELVKLQGFPRGMDFCGPLMFVGLSRLRATDARRPAPISKEFEETFCGLRIINLETCDIIASIDFEGDVDQIYDIAVVPGACAPDLIEPGHHRARHIFDFPQMN